MVISVEECRQSKQTNVTCKSKQEIRDYMQFVTVVTLENDSRFLATEYDYHDKVANYARGSIFHVNPDNRVNYLRSVKRMRLFFRDSYFNLFKNWDVRYMLSIDSGKMDFQRDYLDHKLLSIIYEMNSSRSTIAR